MTKTVSANLLIARPSPALILVFALVVSVCGCGPLVEDGKVSAAKQWRQSFDAAYAQRGAGKLASAETLYKEAFQALSRNQIEDARMGRTCAELSDLLVACGRYIEAEPYALKAITIFEKAWQPEARGESNRDIGVYLLRATGLLAKIYAEEGRASEAEKLFKKALSFDESVLASVELRHKITNDYADLLTRSGRSSEANILKGESKDLATSLTSEQASQTDNLSWKELKQEAKSAYQGGNYANAEKLYKKSIAQAEAEGSDDENVASSLRGLADVYNAQGKYSEAKPLVVRARGIMERKYGAEDSHLKPYLEAEAVVELYTGHLKESQKLYEKALQLSIKQDKGHPHFGTRKLLMKLADVHERQGNLAEAEKMLRKKLQLEEIAHGKEHHKVRDALIDLGNLLLKEKKYKPSEEALLRALNMFEQQGDDDPRVELKVMASYAELLRKSGRTGEAARQETKVKHLKEQLVRDFGALPEEKKELEGEVFDAE